MPPELTWLPLAPDAKARLRALADLPAAVDGTWEALVGLAQTRLDHLEIGRLDKQLRRLFPVAPAGLATRPVRLALLASCTVDPLLPAIRVGGLRHGLWIETYTADYGQYLQELTDRQSALHAFAPDTVLFAFDAGHITGEGDPGASPAAAEAALDAACARLQRNWALAADAFSCGVIQQSLLPVAPSLFGGNEHRLPGSARAMTARLNDRLRALADAAGVDLLAIDAAVEEDGLQAWHDRVLWHRAKQDIQPLAAPYYGDLLARLLAARQGRSAKCLVLDLDNTVWGGVIGDDGLNGIRLGQGSAEGEAFVEFQRYAQALSRRGVILAVCSKNDEANAFEAFDSHPDMVLTRSDIACFAVNWTDKAENLRAIARQLNIGLDALVFADDNPFERNIVRRELPMVAVPELPEDPAFYARCLSRAGYFEGLKLTAEDLVRTAQYQTNLKRDAIRGTATDLDAYLKSLNMELRWSRFDRLNLARVTQLINKTNQFNLTTRRYDEAAVAALLDDPAVLAIHARLVDDFGDNGIIAIVIAKPAGTEGELLIDSWLMSCRVLGRQVEEAVLAVVAGQARAMGAATLLGEYRPTAKNAMVRDHYEKFGFSPLADDRDDGATRWRLKIDGFVPKATHIRITAL